VRGNPELLSLPQIAIVGSRNPSSLGLEIAFNFAKNLSHCGLVITSGLALGIDASHHQGALKAKGYTIAVAGTGLDRIYPARHKDLAMKLSIPRDNLGISAGHHRKATIFQTHVL